MTNKERFLIFINECINKSDSPVAIAIYEKIKRNYLIIHKSEK